MKKKEKLFSPFIRKGRRLFEKFEKSREINNCNNTFFILFMGLFNILILTIFEQLCSAIKYIYKQRKVSDRLLHFVYERIAWCKI